MGAELLLYGYGLVCLSMLGFNVIYSMYLHTGDRRLCRRAENLRKKAEEQMKALQAPPAEGAPAIEPGHLPWLRRRLSRISYLLAFEQFLDGQEQEEESFQLYMQQIQPVFSELAEVYLNRENAQSAYYCYFLDRHGLQRRMSEHQLRQELIPYLKKNSLYCRVNALKALCSCGNPRVLTEGLLKLGENREVQLQEKLITEALMEYKGDMQELIALLWKHFDSFSLAIQRAVLDLVRFQSGVYSRPMEQILWDPARDKELRLAAVRYFGKYHSPSAEEILMDFVQDPDPLRWEYAAVSASALAAYGGPQVEAALVHALGSPNWYVRNNAAASLEARGMSGVALSRVLMGEDPFAKEILTYRMEVRRMRAREKKGNP